MVQWSWHLHFQTWQGRNWQFFLAPKSFNVYLARKGLEMSRTVCSAKREQWFAKREQRRHTVFVGITEERFAVLIEYWFAWVQPSCDSQKSLNSGHQTSLYCRLLLLTIHTMKQNRVLLSMTPLWINFQPAGYRVQRQKRGPKEEQIDGYCC